MQHSGPLTFDIWKQYLADKNIFCSIKWCQNDSRDKIILTSDNSRLKKINVKVTYVTKT